MGSAVQRVRAGMRACGLSGARVCCAGAHACEVRALGCCVQRLGPGAGRGRACWAGAERWPVRERKRRSRAERSGAGWAAQEERKEWVGPDLGVGLGFGFGFLSFFISFVFLTQTTQLFEFKNKFEFNPITQTNKRDAPA